MSTVHRSVRRRMVLAGLLALATPLAGALGARPAMAAASQRPLVFAAASLGGALDEVAAAYVKSGGEVKPQISYASSGTLARQIAQGAPANLFASANERWMNYLAQRGLIVNSSRVALLGNSLVLIVPRTTPAKVSLHKGFPLLRLLGRHGHLAMGDPAYVPAGHYGRAALQSLGLWQQVQGHLLYAENVRAALVYVERGEAQAGIVYRTDAAASHRVVIAGVFPADSHAPIRYPFALVKGHATPQAREFLAFLRADTARRIFERHGFITH